MKSKLKKIVSRILVVALCAMPSVGVLAQTDTSPDFVVRSYDLLKRRAGTALDFHLAGAGQALFFANAFSSIEHNVRLFCTPSKFGLNVGNLRGIVEQEIKDSEHEPETPLAMVLLTGLAKTFPCK